MECSTSDVCSSRVRRRDQQGGMKKKKKKKVYVGRGNISPVIFAQKAVNHCRTAIHSFGF